jgi:hypothetical protein
MGKPTQKKDYWIKVRNWVFLIFLATLIAGWVFSFAIITPYYYYDPFYWIYPTNPFGFSWTTWIAYSYNLFYIAGFFLILIFGTFFIPMKAMRYFGGILIIANVASIFALFFLPFVWLIYTLNFIYLVLVVYFSFFVIPSKGFKKSRKRK